MLYLFTDGACQPNPGKGGWAFVTYPQNYIEKKVSRSGYEENTTNNRMEMKAVLEGLKYLKYIQSHSSDKYQIVLFSDSTYIVDGINSWMHKWAKRNWNRRKNKPLLNVALWKKIYTLANVMTLKCEHVKGHSGHPENEECDQLAVEQIELNR